MSLHVAELTSYTSRLNGGVFFVLSALLPRLQALGAVDPHVFGYRDARTEEDRALWQGVPVTALDPWPPRQLGFTPRIRPTLERFRPNVIHSHGLWTYLSKAALQVHRRQDTPMVISPHGMLDGWALALSARKKRLVGRLYQDAQLREAGALHALNVAEVQAMRAYGLHGPIVVIPNGVDIDPPRGNAPAPWDGHAIASRPNILLFIARLHPKKGLRELVEGWRLAQSHSGPVRDWALAIAGWDEVGIEAELRRSIELGGLSGSVCLCGPLMGDQKAAAFAHAHACILPSYSEGLPMTVLEAWSYGLPAVMTPACNLPEGFARNAALSCAPEPRSIAQALIDLARLDDVQRAVMASAARTLVRERFDWSVVTQSYSALYQALAAGSPLPSNLLVD